MYQTELKEAAKEDFNVENYLETREFQLKYKENFYNILIGKTLNKVIIRTLHFCTDIDVNDLLQYTRIKCNSIDDVYAYIVNNFINGGVSISDIKSYKDMNLFFREQNFDLTLIYYEQNTEHIINNLWTKILKLEQMVYVMREENIQLKEENRALRDQMKPNSLAQFAEIQNNLKEQNLINDGNNKPNFMKFKKNFNINNNNIIKNFNQMNNESFSLLFKESSGNRYLITLDNCSPNEKVSDLMNRYRIKRNDNSNFCFTYNAKQLNPNITLSQAGLMNLVTINVIKGKPPMTFRS
jgi:regulator of replication initiation timing